MTAPIALPVSSLGLVRAAATGAFVLATLYVLCWLGLLVGSTATHAYLALFSTALPSSGLALGQGVCWSLLFGAISGLLVAVFFNIFGFLARK